MNSQNTSPSKTLAIVAFVAAIIGAIAFFLPLVSAYGIVELGGSDLMDTDTTEGLLMIVALVGAGAAALFSLLGLSNRKMLGTAASAAIIAVACIIIAFVSGEVIEYAAYGFWLFVIMEGACCVLSLMSKSKAAQE